MLRSLSRRVRSAVHTPAGSQYIYPALEASHIRVLILQPSFDCDADLRFSFEDLNIRDALGNFDAVSYTWGQQQRTLPLYHEDGTLILVTKNLDMALRRLRRRLDPRRLWADAVCIDQSNLLEKAMQIPLMDRIYRGAKTVFAYLGSGGHDDEKGMQTLIDASQGGSKRRPATSAATAVHIRALLDLPWFRRFWTVQECVLNVDVTLLCGSTEITLPRFIAGLRDCRAKLTDETWSSPGRRAAEKTAGLWKSYAFDETASIANINILDLVDQFLEHDCSDDRDRIFALYALASNIMPTTWIAEGDPSGLAKDLVDERTVLMDVDYSLNVQETYTAFALACARSGMAVRILEAAIVRNLSPEQGEWPSWVPDWRIQPTRRGLLYTKCQSKSPTYLRSVEPRYHRKGCSIQVQAVLPGGKGTTLETYRVDGEPEALFPNVVYTSDSGTCGSVVSILRAIDDLYDRWPMPHYEHSPQLGEFSFNFAKVKTLSALIKGRRLAMELIHYLFELGRDEKLRSFHTFVENNMGLFDLVALSADIAVPAKVASALKGWCVFIAVNKMTRSRAHTSNPLPMVGVGTQTMVEGDKLLIVSPPTKARFKLTAKLEPAWRYHAVIIRSSGDEGYRVVGEAVFFDKEYAPTESQVGEHDILLQ